VADFTLSDWQARELTRAVASEDIGGAGAHPKRRGHMALVAAGLIRFRSPTLFRITDAGREALEAYNARRAES